MTDSRIDSLVLVNTVIAAGLAFLLSPAAFGWLTTAGGLTLLFILFSYDRQKQRSVGQSLAFASVCGLSVALAAGIVLQRLTHRADLAVWLAVTWACATVLGTIIDRYRMPERATPAPGLHIGGVASAPAALPHVTPKAPSHPPPAGQPAAAAPAMEDTAAWDFAQQSQPVAAAQPAQPAPPAGHRADEAIIYVDVIGGGISFLRSVKAEHVARDIYRIVDDMPDYEQWRYGPGQTVRCKIKKLSSGKALVAYQEIALQRVE